jgi:hypothetical protein
MNQIEDRIALKELVDTYAIYGDQRKMKEQADLFSENAVVELYFGGKLTSTLQGRQEIENTFTSFLKDFETAYHFNGQQTVIPDGDTATGIAYCTVTLIGVENGKKMRTTIGIHYDDEYIRVNNQWLISKRKSIFGWQDKAELGV